MSEISASTTSPNVYPAVDTNIAGLNQRCGGESLTPIECGPGLICQIDPKMPIADAGGICKPGPIKKKYILNFSGLNPTYSSGRINLQYTFGAFRSSPVLVSQFQIGGTLDQNKLIGSETLVTVKWKFQSSNVWRTFQFNAICDNVKHSENIWGDVRASPIFFDYKCSDLRLPRPLPVLNPMNSDVEV